MTNSQMFRVKPKLQRFIRRRMQNIGVPAPLAWKAAEAFQSQVDTMGPLGAVDYFKRVGDTIIWYLYASSPEKPTWVKTQNRFPVVLAFLRELPESVLLRVAKLARAIKLDYIALRQVDKVVGGVIKPSEASPDSDNTVSRLIERGVRYYGFHSGDHTPDVDSRPPSVGKYFSRVTSVSGSTPSTKRPPLWESIQILRAVPQLRKLPYWQEALYPLSPETAQRIVADKATDTDHAVGEIHAAQEGGAKLRMFAAPYLVVQCLLRPIHNWIADNFLRSVPTNCTWDQLSGAEFAQKALQQGRTVHSVDLSTATCRFPFWPQIGMLRLMGLPLPHEQALIWACKGTWNLGNELKVPFKRDTLRWEVGQPLGIAPSMSMFSLAHNMLLTGICREKGLEPEDVFRILGDDVVIVSDSVHAEYIRILDIAGVPISWNKSHSSSTYAEFAGASISRTSITRAGQWKQVKETSALGLSKELGTPLYGEVTDLLIRIQKLHLFREGIFSPPPHEWPLYIRLSTMLGMERLSNYLTTDAPLWYYRIMKEWDRQVPWLERGYQPLGHVYDPPNVRKVLFFPLREYLLDDVVAEYHRASIGSTQYMLVAVNAYQSIASLFERGLISENDAAALIGEVSDQIRSLVYEPPSGRNVSLNRLMRQYRRYCAECGC